MPNRALKGGAASWKFVLAIVWVSFLGVLTPAHGQSGAEDGQWRSYNGDLGSTKYSPLDQIDRDNVDQLQIAWRRPAVAAELMQLDPDLNYSNAFRATPLMVDGVLYSSNGVGLVEAFDAGSGETIWVQELDPEQALTGGTMRGVGYWRDGDDERILTGRGNHLYALDAKTGRFVRSFGESGRVDLRRGLQPEPEQYLWTGAPIVVGDIVIAGQYVPDNPPFMTQTRGDVRAYDVRTGEVRWTFRTIPREGEPGVETWENGGWEFTGAANMWSIPSADTELGLVYVPLGAPTSDMYGGHRLGDNLFGNTLAALDLDTGELVWYFQTVHHDLWDYDIPAAPILADITVAGEPVKAVVQITKQGFAFVLDRETGEPVWPIVERPVPPSNVPGERASPTQPYPSRPPPFEQQGVTVDDLIDFTPELRAEAREIAEQYVMGPLFTPPTLVSEDPGGTRGTFTTPSSTGGANWNGAALDPETGQLFIPSATGTFVSDLQPGSRGDLVYVPTTRAFIEGPRGLPLLKPPYGRITAIDLNEGDIDWQVANGDGPRNHPELAHLNLPPLGQPGRGTPLATSTLLFVSEGDVVQVRTPPGGGGRMFRAYDKASGEVAWETELDAGTTGAAMTYMHEGKQYIVVAIGGREHPAEYIALALP